MGSAGEENVLRRTPYFKGPVCSPINNVCKVNLSKCKIYIDSLMVFVCSVSWRDVLIDALMVKSLLVDNNVEVTESSKRKGVIDARPA